MTLGRQWELSRQWELGELLLPSLWTPKRSDGAWSSSTTTDPATELAAVGKKSLVIDDGCSIKAEFAAGGPPGTASPMAAAAACRGTRRSRGSKKRAQLNKVGHRDEVVGPAAGPNPQARCSRRRRKQHSTSSLVTSVPDFDGYQWRKYGQKQIEGAMYPRSYYRCIRSAEQGCPAKRTVQRNDDDDHGSPKYTVVYMADHTCAANDSMEEAPVILETTAAVVAANKRPRLDDDAATSAAGGSTTSSPSTTIAAGTTESSPATSDVTWSGGANNKDEHRHVVDDLYCDDDRSPLLVQDHMDDFTGPIRSPVHVATTTTGGWAIDQYLLHLVNDPIIISQFSAGFSSF